MPKLTGRENIYLNGAILGYQKKQISERIDRIIAFADIGDFIDSPISTYSSGMRSRLGFAVATDISPDVLLLDEVLAVGDTHFRKKATDRVENLLAEATTVFMVSHSMEHIKKMCNRVLLVENSQLIADGPPDEIIDMYNARTT